MDAPTAGIVVGYDGSKDSDVAATWAARTAALSGETVTAVVVMDPVDVPHTHPWPEPWWREIEDRARDTLQRAGARRIAVVRRSGPAAATLMESARDASMLVIGSRGHGRIGEFLLNSVSQRAARRAHCPVVVARPAMDAGAHRVVVGVDGSGPSLRALELACRHAALTHDEVAVVRASRPGTSSLRRHGDVRSATSATLTREDSAIEDAVGRARVAHPELVIAVDDVVGDPSHVLVEASRQAGLLVVGTQGLTALGEAVLGSVSQDVLHKAHCPVAVVH